MVCCYFSQAQPDHELESSPHTGGEILEVFINEQRLTDEEGVDSLAEASRADEDHRAGR